MFVRLISKGGSFPGTYLGPLFYSSNDQVCF